MTVKANLAKLIDGGFITSVAPWDANGSNPSAICPPGYQATVGLSHSQEALLAALGLGTGAGAAAVGGLIAAPFALGVGSAASATYASGWADQHVPVACTVPIPSPAAQCTPNVHAPGDVPTAGIPPGPCSECLYDAHGNAVSCPPHDAYAPSGGIPASQLAAAGITPSDVSAPSTHSNGVSVADAGVPSGGVTVSQLAAAGISHDGVSAAGAHDAAAPSNHGDAYAPSGGTTASQLAAAGITHDNAYAPSTHSNDASGNGNIAPYCGGTPLGHDGSTSSHADTFAPSSDMGTGHDSSSDRGSTDGAGGQGDDGGAAGQTVSVY